jgi:hypothetical protein
MVSLSIFTVVLLALLAPQLEVMTARRKWLLPGACAVLSLSFISSGALHSGYDAGYGSGAVGRGGIRRYAHPGMADHKGQSNGSVTGGIALGVDFLKYEWLVLRRSLP